MTDPTEAAIETIAHHILAIAAREASETEWELYPEIGEHDWTRVGGALARLAPYPEPDDTAAAYELLGKRADHE